jgi:ubiquinone/menaquinone biosynthesis C-methylase UbiE
MDAAGYDKSHQGFADRIAAGYDRDELAHPGTREVIRQENFRLLGLVQSVLDGKVADHNIMMLDVGCGRGRFERLLSQYPLKLIGLDFSRKMIEGAQHTCGNLFVQGAAESLPFRAGLFDVVVMGFGIPSYTDFRQSIPEAWRVLRSRGYLFLTAYNRRGLNVLQGGFAERRNPNVIAKVDPVKEVLHLGDDSIRCHPFDEQELRSELTAAGFVVVELVSLGGLQAAFGPRVLLEIQRELWGPKPDPYQAGEALDMFDGEFCQQTGAGMYLVAVCRKDSARKAKLHVQLKLAVVSSVPVLGKTA